MVKNTNKSIINKANLVDLIAKESALTKADSQRALDAVISSIQKGLKQGKEIRLVGFGTFAVAHRKATVGRNPRTGQEIKIPATRLPKFRAGKVLKELIAK